MISLMHIFLNFTFYFTQSWSIHGRNKTQTAVTNICLNCITFINLAFRMLQHTSSGAIIITDKFKFKKQLYGLGTNEID